MCIIEWVESVYSQSIRTGTFLILALIGIVFVLSLLFSKRKKVHLTLLIFMVVFYIFAKVHCGPSLIDTYRMKPMAEAISNYIVKNGIPKSLKDIPDLPYELEGCKDVDDEKICHYKKSFAYIVRIYTPITNELAVEIFNQNSKTGIQYWFEVKNTKIILERKGNAYSSKTSGICNPMRQ